MAGRASLVDSLLEDTHDAQGLPRYSPSMNRLLAIASGWAYSDAETLSNVLHRSGLLHHRCEYIGVGNDPLFVCAKAFLIQSQCGRLGILCFRGTEPVNLINWMVDVSVDPKPFSLTLEEGAVHGGFYRNVMALWPSLLSSLEKAVQGRPLFTGFHGMKGPGVISMVDRGKAPSQEPALQKLEALFITGHSLGGAMAALAAALLYQGDSAEQERCAPIRQALRGVYTYGQPMVGDAAFTRLCTEFDSRVFRHVYKNDIVPHLPPRSMCTFRHFGREYRWRDKTQQWEPSQDDTKQAQTIFLSSAIGAFDWAKQQIASLRRLRLSLPYSWEAHSPIHYIDTSRHQGREDVGASWA